MEANLKILILEDNQDDAFLLQRELKKGGFHFISEIVKTRKDFEIAIEKLKPDLILSDYSLPSMDGITAFNIKQKISPDIPFIIVSGTIGEENSVELIKNGVTDYVLKHKLFTLPQKIIRALEDTEQRKKKKIADETLKNQYDKLLDIAFLQSHQMRVPVTHILGLFNLFKYDSPSDPINGEVLQKLKSVAESLDIIIHEIVQKTNEIKNDKL
jgi:DNA-binding NtrC family response regulator